MGRNTQRQGELFPRRRWGWSSRATAANSQPPGSPQVFAASFVMLECTQLDSPVMEAAPRLRKAKAHAYVGDTTQQSEVGLWKGALSALQRRHEFVEGRRRDMHWDHRALGEVDGEPRGRVEAVEGLLEAPCSVQLRPNHHDRVVCVLQDGAGAISDQGGGCLDRPSSATEGRPRRGGSGRATTYVSPCRKPLLHSIHGPGMMPLTSTADRDVDNIPH